MMASHFSRHTENMWRAIALKFWEKCNFPNSRGAIDGKHITIVSPANSGSLYFNYKLSFSIVLQALADADYRFFFFVQVGDFGRTSNGGYALGRAMEAKNRLSLQTVHCQDLVSKAQCHTPWWVMLHSH